MPTAQIRRPQRRDVEIADLNTYLENDHLQRNENRARSLVLHRDTFYLDENGLLFSLWTPNKRRRQDARLVIPEALKSEILIWTHDDVTAGHLGTQKTRHATCTATLIDRSETATGLLTHQFR